MLVSPSTTAWKPKQQPKIYQMSRVPLEICDASPTFRKYFVRTRKLFGYHVIFRKPSLIPTPSRLHNAALTFYRKVSGQKNFEI